VKILLISSGAFALKAVDGNTNGSLESGSNHSVSSTNKEQGAWWQVDLGGTKLIQQIRIFNRTDCCKDRLTAKVSHKYEGSLRIYSSHWFLALSHNPTPALPPKKDSYCLAIES
jgi:hypothetical protein